MTLGSGSGAGCGQNTADVGLYQGRQYWVKRGLGGDQLLVNPGFDVHFMFGENSRFKKLVDAMDWQEARNR